jgi:hypothetical protein
LQSICVYSLKITLHSPFGDRPNRGLYIGKYPPPRGGEYQPMSFGGKNMKRPSEKGRKGKEKGRKGKEN